MATIAEILTLPKLQAIIAPSGVVIAQRYYKPLLAAFEKYEINSVLRIAAFLAQCAHESNRFATVEENLNYRAQRLVEIFPKYFPNIASTAGYANNPQKIGSKVYGSRMGNGNEASGEGYKFHGRGLIQLTGKNNYVACGKSIGVDLIKNPDYLLQADGAALSACWFWSQRSLNSYADRKNFYQVTQLVNGGQNGADDRNMLYARALKILSDGKDPVLPDDSKEPSKSDQAKEIDKVNPATSAPISESITPPATNKRIVERKATAGGKYPLNLMYKSPSGHVIELDDSSGKERVNIQHASGTYIEMVEDGNITQKSINDSYDISTKDAYHYVGETLTQTVGKQAFFKHGLTIFKSDSSIYLDAATRVQANTPMLAFTGLLTGPKADIEEGFFESLHVVNVIDGTAEYALRIGSKAGASFSVDDFNAAIELGDEKTTMKKPVHMLNPLEIGSSKFDIISRTIGGDAGQVERVACIYDPSDGTWRSIRDNSVVTPNDNTGGSGNGE